MKHARLCLLLTVAIGASLAFAAPPEFACTQLSVSSAAEPRTNAVKGFSATKTLDLTLSLTFNDNPSTDHVAELKIFTPDGALYRSITLPIPAASKEAVERVLPDYPRPIKERHLINISTQAAKAFKLDFTLPVAGTDIVANGLYGSWSAQPFLDGKPKPCTKTLTFKLKP